MSLATRCPKCQTLFKVTLGQLQIHEGQVRCGRCRHVFSGIDHLTAADSEAWTRLSLEDKAENTPATEPGFLLSNEPKRKASPKWLNLGKAPKSVRLSMIGLSLLLVLQCLWWQRVPLLSNSTTLGDWIAKRSTGFQWLFAAPADTSLELQGSGLSREPGNVLRVDLTLFNHTALPSRWPHVRIRLRDSQGLEIASKMLKPEQYLKLAPEALAQAPPIAPGETVEVLAYLNLGDLVSQIPGVAPTGFQVQLYDNSIDLN